MLDGSASWICSPAGVEAAAVSLCRTQPQGLPTAGVCQLGSGHDGVIVLEPGDAGCGGALDVAGEDCRETQHH